MLRLQAYELKLLLCAWKRVLAGVAFLLVFCALVVGIATAFPATKLFAPFTVGLVDNDNSPEITLLLQMLAGKEQLSALIAFERMPQPTADARLAADDIPAYIIIPQGFIQGVITGDNPPLKLVGNESRVIQLSVTRLLVGAGVAFLTTSQAGIYATLNYAYEQGVPWQTVLDELVMPINVEYMKALLDYDSYFSKTELSATDGLSRSVYYRNSALIYLMQISLITLVGPLLASTSQAAMRRYRMCGIPRAGVLLHKLVALWLLFTVLVLPLTAVYGPRVLAVCVMLAGLTLMCSQLFRSEQAAGLFLFSLATLTLFASGGALPLAYLPQAFGRISLFTPNYWFIRIDSPLAPGILCCFGAVFFCIAIIKEASQ